LGFFTKPASGTSKSVVQADANTDEDDEVRLALERKLKKTEADISSIQLQMGSAPVGGSLPYAVIEGRGLDKV
jgi:hypothetical protein